MNKVIKFFTAFIIMLIALPLGANIVKADEGLDEGNYKVDFVILHEDKETISSMDNYSEKDYADLSIDDKGKKTVAIYIENNDMIQNFKVNGVEKWNEEINEAVRKIEFPVEDIEQLQKGEVTIDTGSFGPGIMEHTVYLKFTLKEDAEDPNEDPKEDPNEEPGENQVELNESNPVKQGETVTVKGEKDFQLKMPNDLPANVKLAIKPVKNANVKNKGNIEIAGQVYEFDFQGLGGYDGKFELVMSYDKAEFDADQVDIYYFDEGKEQWIAQNGEAKDGKVTVTVDHFSTYGVFANVSKESLLTPDKAFKIGYTIFHENGKETSLSDEFFEKPALLFEKDGNKYVHLTIENGEMIQSLSNKYGKAIVVKDDDGGSKILQLRVDDDLSDMELDMHIVVPAGAIPGFPGYDNQHKALLVFDNDSMEKIAVDDHLLIGTNNPHNQNGIYVEDGSSNELSESDDTEEVTGEPTNTNSDKDLNPKTGDTNNIGFYTFLLVSSLMSLGFLIRKHRFN